MIAHKHITKIIAAVMAATVILCLCAAAFSDRLAEALGGTGVSMEYESKLFDTSSVLSINILMDESDWADMLENALAEEYYSCDVEINGTTFYRVGIRPKGNTSLSSIASDPTTDRYSFKLEFDHYVEGQTCFGLDKLVLNNNYADATNMKEALVYDMFQYLGADASLYNYAKISVNGEYWGVYLALEAVEDSFLLRNYGAQNGALYKPEGMDMGGGKAERDQDFADLDFKNMDFSNMTPPDRQEDGDAAGSPPTPPSDTGEDTGERPGQNGDAPGGGFSMNSGGADLNYTDDDLDSYDTIWEGAVTETKKSDRKRVVTALKNISEGNDLETYLDIDNLLRYLAVHIFSVNEDSLSGSMAHNYYLYETGGQLNLIPWDYNLAFGGMGGGNDASGVVNSAIDDAFSITDFFDTLLADENYHSQYDICLQKLVDEYVNGGGFDAFYTRVRSQIDELVETDPTAFYSYDEYQAAAETLYQVVQLRAQSIQGQLDGTIPSTETEQRSSDALVDASALDLSVMGSMNGGGGGGPQNRPTPGENAGNAAGQPSADADTSETTGGPPSGFDPTQMGGTMPGGFDPTQRGGESQNASDTNQTADESAQTAGPPGNFPGMSENTAQTVPTENLVLYGASILALAVAAGVAGVWRRRG